MSLEFDYRCDECNAGLEVGDDVYCLSCFGERVSQEEVAERIEEATADLTEQLKELTAELEELRAKVA